MILTQDEAVEWIGEKTIQNTQDIRQKNRQRRHQVVDMYGVEYTRQGDGGSPATFYVSISPDMVYMERFEFKLIIQPFVSTAAGTTESQTVNVKDTELTLDNLAVVNGTNLIISDDGIEPNPHSHETDPHSHDVVAGISLHHTTASDFRISIEGIDVTPYLMAQYGSWIDGEGVYPSLEIGKDYDILEVASDLVNEGRKDDADKLIRAGYKAISITSSQPFQVTLVLYLKLSHLNR